MTQPLFAKRGGEVKGILVATETYSSYCNIQPYFYYRGSKKNSLTTTLKV
jgi:hypothetical protein